jgi:glutathione synthase/RimK-type ligase-like ATP-grasp enzyme
VVRLSAARLGDHLASAAGSVFVQPFAQAVLDEGEHSFAVIGGEVSHVLRKRPAAGDFRAHGIYGGTVEAHTPAAGDLAEMRDLYTRLPFDLDYARIDVVRFDGRLAVLELELIEPILYLALAPGAADRLASAVLHRRRT